jgi:acyl-CoA synthetase (AMP-forming)/AMP-acid ligase II
VVQDGFIRTRDLVRDLGDGFLVHMGRVDDVITVRGFKLASGEVETLLRSVPGVGAAFVFKSEHDETLVAAIVSNGQVARSDLARAASLHLERFKRPAAYFQVAELPTKGLGKADRREIIRRAANGEFEALN